MGRSTAGTVGAAGTGAAVGVAGAIFGWGISAALAGWLLGGGDGVTSVGFDGGGDGMGGSSTRSVSNSTSSFPADDGAGGVAPCPAAGDCDAAAGDAPLVTCVVPAALGVAHLLLPEPTVPQSPIQREPTSL